MLVLKVDSVHHYSTTAELKYSQIIRQSLERTSVDEVKQLNIEFTALQLANYRFILISFVDEFYGRSYLLNEYYQVWADYFVRFSI